MTPHLMKKQPRKKRMAVTKNQLVLILLLLVAGFAKGQLNSKSDSSYVNHKRLRNLVIGAGASYGVTMFALSKVWYSDFDHQSFSFFDDSKEWMQVDKLGHFYSTFQLSAISSRALKGVGLPQRKSDNIGALTSFLMVASIEIFDGFSSGYGASASDLIANGLGASFFLGQNLLWEEVRIYPKFSFHTTHYPALRPDLLGHQFSEEIIKDYNGQTYWLSVDMDKFIAFPKWLNLAVGYGAHDMIYASRESNLANGFTPYRQVYLSLDFDITSIHTKSKALKTLIYIANMIKLPAPTLEFSQGKVKTHAFYF